MTLQIVISDPYRSEKRITGDLRTFVPCEIHQPIVCRHSERVTRLSDFYAALRCSDDIEKANIVRQVRQFVVAGAIFLEFTPFEYAKLPKFVTAQDGLVHSDSE